MTEQTLLRLAMILQDQAPSTLNKYICKLAEVVLLDYPDGINLFDLNSFINQQFNLTFTEEEVEQAISKKGHNRIIVESDIYKLTISAQRKLATLPSIAENLSLIVRDFLETSSSKKSVDEITSLSDFTENLP